ncbi:complement factor B isoform X3 [Halichoerus grypus]
MGSNLSPQLCLISLVLGLLSGGGSTTPLPRDRPQGTCSLEGIEIKGGSFRLLKEGQALEYECPSGFYPYPVQARTCRSTGSWSALQTQDQKIVKKAECRAIRCPRPQEFENGEYWPRAPYYNLSDEISFHCYDGYTLRGSANRTCQATGRWDGQTAICDDGAGYCPNPGIPIGTRKVGSQYRLEDSVTYYCNRGLTLRGSQQRTCQEGGSWSGTEPSCQDSFMYDTPEEVAEAFLSSLTETIEGVDAEDGHSPGLHNMGGDPVSVIHEIRDFLYIGGGHKNPREDYLDIYVFGVGPLVNQENINALASKKDQEQHVFKVKDMENLEDVFIQMLDETRTLGLCGMVWEHKKGTDYHKQPWQAKISVTRPLKGHETCMGAVVSEYFVLTAAHCFTVDDQEHSIKVSVGGTKQELEIQEILFHPDYNINGKKAEGIHEFYDYDVALIRLKKRLTYDQTVRPICLPCTQGTNQALRLPLSTTCQQQMQELLPAKDIKAMFVSELSKDGKKMLIRKEVYIKNGDKKASCERDARYATGYDKVKDISEVVTPRFLCTGGVNPYADPNTCRGDSGGPLIIHKRSRFIQVGVISWGVVDVCKDQRRWQQVPAHARDFHINLFQVRPWLKDKLKDEGLDFL